MSELKVNSLRSTNGLPIEAPDGIVGLTVPSPGVGGVARTAADKVAERVSLKDFGAACDGVTDDALALQAAINYCLSFPQARTLVVPGKSKISLGVVKLDRLVDTTSSKFHIVGEGPGAGFVYNGAGELFSSTFVITVGPLSERLRFEHIRFECTSPAATLAYVFSKAFLRLEFEDCEFLATRFMLSDVYVQDMWFDHCRINSNPVNFIKCDGLYNVNFLGGSMKFGNTLIENISTSRGTNGLKFSHGFLAEGLATSMVRANGATVSVIGCHFEANKLPMFNFFVGGVTNQSITFIGNYDFNPDHPLAGTLYYGPTVSVLSAGNNSFPNVMHAQITSVTNFVSVADTATLLSDPTGLASLTTTQGGIRTNAPFTQLKIMSTTGSVGIGNAEVANVRMYCRGEGATSATHSFVSATSGGQPILECRNDKQVRTYGPVGFNGATAQPAVGLPPDGTDLATTMALVNTIKSRLIGFGLAL